MTVAQALAIARVDFAAAGVPEPRLDAEYLLAHVLGVPRLSLRMNGEAPLAPGAQAAFDALAARRRLREPLQYILGTQEFMGLTFRVTPDALIPRQDTETLCEQALLRLAPGMRALDLCTGSGALAVSLCVLGGVNVDASDLSAAALALARENAAANGADVRFFAGAKTPRPTVRMCAFLRATCLRRVGGKSTT